MFGKRAIWIYWLIVTVAIAVYLVMNLLSDDKSIFLPGETSHGHHQIEIACNTCHTDAFAGGEVLQDACIKCHGAELKLADDSHPKAKFTDPRNADTIEKLDARVCIACHVEHKPEITLMMGVTLPEDFCFKCHSDIAEDRPSHTGMAFNTCASAGCHNFHDNRSLYEDFIAKHLDEPMALATAKTANRIGAEDYITLTNYPLQAHPFKELGIADMDAPITVKSDKIENDWLETGHSKAGVNCAACHQQADMKSQSAWVEKPDHSSCAACHEAETQGFLSGKHGMRLAEKLPPMTPAMAKIPMKTTASEKILSCVSCHSAHRFDTRLAEVDACLGCHDDTHSRNYKNSRHYELWKNELIGGEKNTGVTCATCHMPRVEHRKGGMFYVLAQHNQNDNLRPNEKMIRGVCMDCHGLGFTINALADGELIKNNFTGKPVVQVQSLELVRERVKRNAGEKSQIR